MSLAIFNIEDNKKKSEIFLVDGVRTIGGLGP